MKNVKTTLLLSFILSIAILTSFKPIKFIDPEQCGDWQKDPNSDIQLKTCHYLDDVNFRTFQLYNPYGAQIRVSIALEFSNGPKNTWTLYIDPRHESDKTSTNHREITSWAITQKQKKNSTGDWVNF